MSIIKKEAKPPVEVVPEEPKTVTLILEPGEVPLFMEILRIATSGFPESKVSNLVTKLKAQLK